MERESTAVSKVVVSKHEAIVVSFLKEAIQEGAHGILPKHTSKDQWTRLKQIGILYNLTPADLEDLKNAYGLNSKERTRQIAKAFLRSVWNNCTSNLKERYTLGELLTARKPWSQGSKERMSAKHGGISLRIKEQVEKGVTDTEKISENTGIPKEKINTAASKTLKEWGIGISIKRLSYKKALKQLEEETDDKNIQQLLDQLPYFVLLTRPDFLALRTVAMEAGFHYKPKDTNFFARSLQKAGIPITIKEVDKTAGGLPLTLRYYILSSRYRERAIQALVQDQCLQRFLGKSSSDYKKV